MSKFVWNPGNNDIKAPLAYNDGLPITNPPCNKCLHWRPEVTFRDDHRGQVVDGVRLCHAKEMFHDFTCFILGVG